MLAVTVGPHRALQDHDRVGAPPILTTTTLLIFEPTVSEDSMIGKYQTPAVRAPQDNRKCDTLVGYLRNIRYLVRRHCCEE